MNKNIYIVLFLLFSLVQCKKGFQTRKLVYRDKVFAFFTLKKEEFEYKKYIPDNLNHPFHRLSENAVQTAFGKIHYRKTSSIGEFHDALFHKKDLERLAEILVQVVERAKKDEIVIAILLSNESDSVLPSYTRTTMLFWIDKQMKMNVVFGDLDRFVPYDTVNHFSDWGQMTPIRIAHIIDSNEIMPSKYYSYGKVRGFNNKRWLVFDLNDQEKFKLKKNEDVNPPETKVKIKKN